MAQKVDYSLFSLDKVNMKEMEMEMEVEFNLIR
jgi:hypothetical protein